MSHKFGNKPFEDNKIYGKAKVMLHDEKPVAKIVILESGDTYYSEGQFPSQLQAGFHRVTLEVLQDDRVKVESFLPCSEHLPVVYLGMVHDEDKPPMPKDKTPNHLAEKGVTVLKFYVILKVFDGDYAGLEFRVGLQYKFYGNLDKENNKLYAEVDCINDYYQGRLTHGGRLRSFMNHSGAGEFGPIPYVDNLLPSIDARCKKAQKKFMLEVNDGGWPHIFYPWSGPDNDFGEFDVPENKNVAGGFEFEEDTTPPWTDGTENDPNEALDFESNEAWDNFSNSPV